VFEFKHSVKVHIIVAKLMNCDGETYILFYYLRDTVLNKKN